MRMTTEEYEQRRQELIAAILVEYIESLEEQARDRARLRRQILRKHGLDARQRRKLVCANDSTDFRALLADIKRSEGKVPRLKPVLVPRRPKRPIAPPRRRRRARPALAARAGPSESDGGDPDPPAPAFFWLPSFIWIAHSDDGSLRAWEISLEAAVAWPTEGEA
jgi:hypothetical protein